MPDIINFVGIDMAKNDFYACLNDIIEPSKFNNDTKGIKSFFGYLKKHNFITDNTMLGVESTASYHLKLCIMSTENNYKIKVINPLIVKKQNQTDLRRVKNDKKDSGLIRFCLAGGAGYEFINDPEAIILKSLVRQRDSLVSAKLKFDRQEEDIRRKEKCLTQAISPVYREIINVLEDKIEALKTDLRLYRPKEQYLLQSIPGVGPITAASFISEVGDISRFQKPEQLVAYAGIDPRVHQSGTSINGKGYITKRGNKILRTRLFNAASVAVLYDNMFKTFFQKKKSEGKPYRVALVATMRKMTHVIHAVWTRGTPFVK
jgi:transposase